MNSDQYVNALRAEVERLRLQMAGEPIPGELISAPALDVDQQLRVAALQIAATRFSGSSSTATLHQPMIDLAERLLPWLRGDDGRLSA